MKCPMCGAETKVVDSRDRSGLRERRRECRKCGWRFTTYEAIIPSCEKCKYSSVDKYGKFCNNPESRRFGNRIEPTSGCRKGRE